MPTYSCSADHIVTHAAILPRPYDNMTLHNVLDMSSESAPIIMHALWSELTVVNNTLQPQCSPLNTLLLS